MLLKATGVIMTTCSTILGSVACERLLLPTMKFQIQFAVVDTALAGARILNGTISEGYNLLSSRQF